MIDQPAVASNRYKLFLPLVFFLLLMGLLFVGLRLDPNELPSVLIDKPMPQFALPSLADPEVTLTPADFNQGKPYLLNVWATWCPTCKYEHPFLLELAKLGIPIYGVNYQDDVVAARELLAKTGDPYIANVVDETGELILALGVTGAPETFVVDSDGVIRDKIVGIVDQKVWTGKFAHYFIGE